MNRAEKKKHLSDQVLYEMRRQFDEQLTDEMGHLYNRFVAYISESRTPLPMVITVLQMLLSEAIEMAAAHYKKEK